MDLKTFCHKLPKIELHAHLNGSVSKETIKKLIRLQSKDPDNPTEEFVNSNIEDSVSLKECFLLFEIVHKLTDTPDALYLTACDVIQDFYDDNVIYLELRSTPRSIPGKMTKHEYIDAIIKAIEASKETTPNIIVKLLISVNRKQGFRNAKENVELAIEYHKKYPDSVVGIDLSGDPTEGEAYLNLFQKAKDEGLKFAAHCAEVPNEKEVIDILNFKPDRLGHCTHIHPNLNGSEDIYSMLLTSKIPVEVCITSNLKCKMILEAKDHQFGYFYKDEHPVCISTDDKGIFNTTLSKEYELVATNFGLTNQNLIDLSLSAVSYIFASDEEKSKLLSVIQSFSDSL